MLTHTSPPVHPYTRTVNRLGWSLMAFLGLFYLITVNMESFFLILTPTTLVERAAYGFLSTIAYIAPFLLSAGIYFMISRPKKGRITLPALSTDRRVRGEGSIPAVFPLFVIAGLGINLLAAYGNHLFCTAIGYEIPEELYEIPHYDIPGSIILYMGTAIAPAFAEEFLFRGVVYGSLRPYGKWQAVIISSLTFSLMHQNISQIIYTFVCGVILALMYEWTGSIWCSIFFHLFNNGIAVFSDVLLFGAYGESAEIYLSVWNLIIVVLALASTLILLIFGLRARKARHTAAPGIFGRTSEMTEVWEKTVSAKSSIRALCAPGMLLFIVLTFLTVVGQYIEVLSLGGML